MAEFVINEAEGDEESRPRTHKLFEIENIPKNPKCRTCLPAALVGGNLKVDDTLRGENPRIINGSLI